MESTRRALVDEVLVTSLWVLAGEMIRAVSLFNGLGA